MFVFKESGEEPTVEQLGDELAALAAQMSAAMCRWLLLLARFDELGGWFSEGCVSCAHWVSWRCGVAPVTAREHVRIAQRLGAMPATREAFSRGELSYSKVRALVRVGDVHDEAELVELARHASAAQLERIVAAFRGVTREEADAAYADRSLHLFTESDGTVYLNGRLPAELGAVVVAAIRHAEDQLERRATTPPDDDAEPLAAAEQEHERPSAAARRADALVWLAQTACAAAVDAGRLTSGKVELTVLVDAATLTAPAADAEAGKAADHAGQRAELQGGAPLAAETIRRLCCDAGIVPTVVDEAGAVLDVGRRTRSIPPAIRRALAVRDAGCCFPGCDRTRWLQAHHVEHWAHGGPTSLDNLVLLCHHHHQLVHEGGYVLTATPAGSPAVLTPDGRLLEPVPHRPQAAPPEPARARLQARRPCSRSAPGRRGTSGSRSAHSCSGRPRPCRAATPADYPEPVSLRVLLTNDDGIDAEGLQVLRAALAALDGVDLQTVAPDGNRSAIGRGITTRRALMVQRVDFDDGSHGFATDGTPVDCVRLAALGLIDGWTPQIVVSGINHGANLGDDVTYSGTVAAAMEGLLLGLPAIAVSQQSEAREMDFRLGVAFDFAVAARFVARVVGELEQVPLPPSTLLNINVPAGEPNGVEIARLGRRIYRDRLDRQDGSPDDPVRSRRYFIYGDDPGFEDEPGTDMAAVHRGHVAITPLHLDLTFHDGIGPLTVANLDRLLSPAASDLT